MNLKIISNLDLKAKVNTGFTLIELLIVMAIIAVLSGLSLFSLQGARKQGRDGKRKSDLEVIRSSLEIYKADCNSYPTTATFNAIAVGGSLSGASCAPVNANVYMQSKPGDPSSGQVYSYNRLTATTYVLCSTLEDPPSPANDTSSCTSCGTAACGYKVTNP